MVMFIIQAFLLLAIAYILGCIVGTVLHGLFAVDAKTSTPAVAAAGAVAATAAASASTSARASTSDYKDSDYKAGDIKTPAMPAARFAEVKADTNLEGDITSKIEDDLDRPLYKKPEVKAEAQLDKPEINLPEISKPEIDVDADIDGDINADLNADIDTNVNSDKAIKADLNTDLHAGMAANKDIKVDLEAERIKRELEIERKARLEAEEKMRAEHEAKLAAEERAREAEAARLKAEQDQIERQREEQERRRAEAEARAKAEADARAKAEAEAKAKLKAEEEATALKVKAEAAQSVKKSEKASTKPKKADKSVDKKSKAVASTRDDLKLIKGIGPQNEARLNAIDVYTFKEIAGWGKRKQAEIGERLAFPGRIEREDWVGQAKILAKGKSTEFSERQSRKSSSASDKALRVDLGKAPRSLPGPRKSGADDLTQVNGIGKAIQEKLNALGIFHYNQIAQWSEANQDWIGYEIGHPGRVQREEWVSQAQALL